MRSRGQKGTGDETNLQLYRIGRLLVFAVVAAFASSVATLVWVPIQRALGWLLLPLGQRSLTAYSVHVFVVQP